jgi:IS5 family transposase
MQLDCRATVDQEQRRRMGPGNAPVEEGQRLVLRNEAHIGVNAASGLVHTVVGTAGSVSDVMQAHTLLHGDEVAAFGDTGHQGVEKRAENIGESVTWHVAMKRAKRKVLPKNKPGPHDRKA